MSRLVTIVEYYSRRSNGYAVETKRKCGMHFHRQKKKRRDDGKRKRRCGRQKCIREFSDLPARSQEDPQNSGIPLSWAELQAARSTDVALYPSFLIRVHHPRGVLFSFASLLSLSLFLLSLLVSSSLYKSKDEPRCYVFLPLHLVASLSPSSSSRSLASSRPSSISLSLSRSPLLPLVRNAVLLHHAPHQTTPYTLLLLFF